jgi:TonB-dependent receptor
MSPDPGLYRVFPGLLLFAAVMLLAQLAVAQESPEDVFRDLGTATAAGEEPVSRPGEGTVAGRVFDAATGQPLERVTVLLKFPSAPDGEPSQEVQITDADGAFEFASVPPGLYQITYIKAGYRNSTMTDFMVRRDALNRADFPLPPLAADESGEVLQLEEFVVEAATAAEMMASLETRLESDQLLNIMSEEDFSKYAAGDVAEALRRVAGVNIVEGQFAIIRGLEDRYSSTLYNSAPVPSPDPDRQSVQLDLFPTEVVTSLNVAKTFTPELPSNSSGGSINILTLDYPEEIEFKFKAGVGYNDNAKERFLWLDGVTHPGRLVDQPTAEDLVSISPLGDLQHFKRPIGNPVGEESGKTGNWIDDVLDVLESDFVGVLGGRRRWGNREFRLKLVGSREVDFKTAFGFQQGLEPRSAELGALDPRPGDLAFGLLPLSDGRFDLTTSLKEEQRTAFGAFGFDLDEAGNHRVDASAFYTRKEEEIVQHKENGYLPGFIDGVVDSRGRLIDYEFLIDAQVNDELFNRPDSPGFRDVATRGSWIARDLRASAGDPLRDGGLIFGSFFEGRAFERDRSLLLYQVQGDHLWEELPGLHLSWVWNHAETSQDDSALRSRMFFEPCGFNRNVPCPPGVHRIDTTQISNTDFPLRPEHLGPGVWVATPGLELSANVIEESSDFYRVDGDYEIEFSEKSTLKVSAGVWFETAERDVESVYLETPSVNADTEFAITGESPFAIGETLFDQLDFRGGPLGGRRFTTSEASRDIDAWYAAGKWTLWEKLDLLGGVRRERIFIESLNVPFVIDPLTGQIQLRLGGPQTFPSRFVLFDRLDDSFEFFPPPPPDKTWNDQILGIDVSSFVVSCTFPTPGQCVNLSSVDEVLAAVSGEIDETYLLPSAGFTFRPIEGLVLRGGWSRTVARPSFRELGYYVSVEPGTDDLTVGNPQLQLSEVESFDVRLEYTWGSFGDLFAVSAFNKDIDDPVERIVVRDQSDFTFGAGMFRTFFNNPNPADLRGIEVEARKNFDWLVYLGGPDWLNYLSIGGNFTYIDAEVGRTEAELKRSEAYFLTPEGVVPKFAELEPTRRLFNQPEWIANADLTFDHPDWGLRATVAYFAISDVLDAAGTATLGPSGDVIAFTLDRYVDSFYELRATVAKTFQLPRSFGEMTFRITGKNLTDSPRRILYDPVQTDDDFVEREVRVGRDYSVSLTYTRTF